jgi:serine/threonine protein phosphatase PrpC
MELSPKAPTIRTDKDKIIFSQKEELLDGAGVEDLGQTPKYYKFASGDVVVAGTDKGVDYKDHNEDVVAVSPEKNFIVVADGMGGYGRGDQAARILAENLLLQPNDVTKGAAKAVEDMRDQGMRKEGAVFISARVLDSDESKKSLEVFQSGDAKMIIVKKDGSISFESVDESYIQDILNFGQITPDEALYHNGRNMVTSAISPHLSGQPKSYEDVEVEPGDAVLLMSDGISDNITADEIGHKVKEGMTPSELYVWLSESTKERMTNKDKIIDSSDREKDGKYSDGFKSKPKNDNRALAILEIK